jgi:hypothetical protein
MTKPTEVQIHAARYIIADATDSPDAEALKRAFIKADPRASRPETAWTYAMHVIGGDVYGTFAQARKAAEAVLRKGGAL